jgi:HEAT repeat protein
LITRSGGCPAVSRDDDGNVNDFVVRVALLAFAAAFVAWIALSVTVVAGRVWYDRRHRESGGRLRPRRARRLIRRALSDARTDWGRWRRIAALTRLAQARHPATRRVLRRSVADPDPHVAAAAVRALGDLGDEWAIELLLDALREGRVPRSRVASQLERLAPVPGAQLLPLLRDPDAAVRFWGATLLAPYRRLGQADLLALTRDVDPNVRAAAVETLGGRGGEGAARAALELLEDPAWFVRVHAARAAGQVAGAPSAPALTQLLSDDRWWVRTAAKDALRSLDGAAVAALLPVLGSPDEFARNGAAEILQDIGYVDHLAVVEPDSPLLARIYAAGGERLRQAAELRAASRSRAEEARAA